MRRRWVLGGAVAAVLVVVAAVLWWPSGGSDADQQPVRQRVYPDVTACLLTGSKGLAEQGTGPVWAGMQDASARSHVQVSYLAATGARSAAAYLPYLNSLLQRRCGVVLAADPLGGAVLREQAATHPGVRFVVVGAGGGAAANVVALGAGDRAGVASAIESAFRG